ncbi:MAG: hypothetical protein ACRD6B_03920 [Bryobacteraceae bacterium]
MTVIKPLPHLIKGDVGYMDHHVVGTIPRCISCMDFGDVGKNVTDGSCAVVVGPINSDGICNLYNRVIPLDSSTLDDRTGDAGGRY